MLLALGVFALVLLPFVLGPLGAPTGEVFSGTLKALGDESEYLSAVRQGAQGNWLWHNPFMVHTPPPILMYLPYLAFGHFGALLGLSVLTTYALMHCVAAILLFGTLWVLGSGYLPRREHAWFVAFALGTSGLYWLDAIFAVGGHAPASLVWMGMPPLSGLTSALMGAHETLGSAGQVMVLTGVMGVTRGGDGRRWPATIYGAVGTLLVGLTLPMLLPIPLMVAGLVALRWVWQAGPGLARARAFRQVAVYVGLIVLPGLLAAVYYYWQLRYGAWSASSLSTMGARPFAESLLEWGAVLPLGLWGWWRTPASARPLAGALALWCCCALGGVILPFWQGFRFSTGLTMMVGALFALGVLHSVNTRRWRVRILLMASLGALVHFVFLLSVLAPGQARSLYVSARQQQAMEWLAAHTSEQDVVLAPLGFSNRLPILARSRLVAGHGYMTFDMPLRDRQLHLFYNLNTAMALRLQVLRATAADYVVYDAGDIEDGSYNPQALPGLRTVYANSHVTILRTTGYSP